MFEFNGSTAVILAGGNGIGRSMALALAKEGANVVVADIMGDCASRVRDEIIALGRGAVAVTTDVTMLEDVQRVAEVAYSAFGTVDVLCNNAGVAIRPMRPIWENRFSDIQWQLNVNVGGMLNAIHVFLPRMLKQTGRRHIVNTASMAVFTPVIGNSMYALSKCGIDGFSDVIREELALENIGLTVLYPGLVSTEAPENTRKLRSAEDQQRDAETKSFLVYAAEKAGLDPAEAATIRGGGHVIDPGETTKAIEPEIVGQMIVEAIRNNRPRCMTHPAPADAIRKRTAALLDAYHPLPYHH